MPRCCQKRFVRARSRATASSSSATRATTDDPVLDVRAARLAPALGRRAPAAAAGRLDEEDVARAHRDADFFGLQHARRAATREQAVAVGQTILAAENPVRGMPRA